MAGTKDIKDFTKYPSLSDNDYLLGTKTDLGGTDAGITVSAFKKQVSQDVKPEIKNGYWWVLGINTGQLAVGKTPQFRYGPIGLEIKYEGEDDTAYVLIIPLSDLVFTFDKLTPDQKLQIKLKFSDLTEADKLELRGEAFTYDMFTDEQLNALRLTWDKLTPAQKLELRGERGYSAFEVWTQREGNADKTEEEYLAWLRQPATEAAARADEKMIQLSQDVNQVIADTEEVKDRADKSASDADTARISLSESVQQKLTEVDNKMLTVQDGEDGKTTQFEIGTVESGSQPAVSFTDKGTDAQGNPIKALNLTLQQGKTGATPVLETGETTTSAPGTQASLSLVPNGTTPEGVQKYKTNAVIPAGATGSVEGLYKTQDIDHVPGENDLTYEEAGKTYPFQIGNELRFYDTDKAEHVFYKLFDIADSKAVWKLAGSGGGSDDGLVFLTVPETFETSYIEIKDGGLGGL